MISKGLVTGRLLALVTTLLLVLTAVPPMSTPVGASGFRMDSDLKDSQASFWGEDEFDFSGYSVAGAGDVNGDGYDDILIGAYADDNGGDGAGQTYLVLGQASSWAMDIDLSNVDASFWGEDADDLSGYSVAGAGDVNGDGYDDILIGAYMNDGGGWDSGQTYLILGKASGWAMDTDLSNADASFLGEVAGDCSGYSVAGAGDVNSDGYSDILIGAFGNSDGGSLAGQTYLVLGKATGWAMDTDLSNADASFLGEDTDDYSGFSVASAGDVNSDGYDDILIGAIRDEDGGSSAGQTYLILGKASGWSMDTDLSNADASFWGENADDFSGFSVAGAGDVNGDGCDDILIGVYSESAGGTFAGQTYLILGKASGWTMDTDLSNADASFWGENAVDYSGWSVAGPGDVNDDGYDDILIGAFYNTDGGVDAGQTYLIEGKASGWAMDTDLSNADASFWGEGAGDNSGTSVAGAGDVNGDGYDDILIGAPGEQDGGNMAGQTYLIFYESAPTAPNNLDAELSGDAKAIDLSWDFVPYWKAITGYDLYRSEDGIFYDLIAQVNGKTLSYTDTQVVFGKTYRYRVAATSFPELVSPFSRAVEVFNDIDTDIDNIGNMIDPDDDNDGIPDALDAQPLVRDDTRWARADIDLADFGTGFVGEDADDWSGYFVAGAGDVNGDGYDDILIGAHYDDDGGANAGQTYLILGKASGWATDTDLSNVDASFRGEDAGDWSGYSVTGAGDVNGDGYDDILIGAYGDDDGGINAGQTYLILGKASGWAPDTDLSTADASFWGEDASDWSGYSVAGAGDVNCDGYDDILIGAYLDDDGGGNAGQTYLILGRASGWAPDTDLSTADASFWGENANDRSGMSVAGAGDVNGDGYDDILIGANLNSDGGGGAGQTYLIFGKASGWAMDTDLSIADASFLGEDMNDNAGISVAGAGDVNGDGYDDILIGAYLDDDCGVNAGQTYIILGKASGWAMDTDLSTADASFWGEDAGDQSGYSFAGAGDVNGDGYDDILIGALMDDDGGADAGQTYFIIGKASGWAMDTDLSTADASFWGEAAGDWSGRSVAGAGDVNGDGYNDILIGANGDDDGGTNAGQTYLITRSITTTVQNLSLKLSTSTIGINLQWNDDHNRSVYSYGIYRGRDADSLYRLATTLSANYTDTNVTLGVEYWYAVTAFDPLGGETPIPLRLGMVADQDLDSDGLGNLVDLDNDGDGIPDSTDVFPLDATEWLDTDWDGIGNTADADDDNDGTIDALDAAPLNPLNGIQSDIALMSTTLQDVQGTVTDIKVDLALMNGNLTALSTKVTAMNNSLTGLIGGLSSDITGLNATLQQEIITLEADLKKDIGGLNKTMQQDLYDLEVGLSSDIAGLDTALGALNASLHTELTAMETENQAFRDETAVTLQEILDRLDTLDLNMTGDIQNLQTTLNNLNSTTLAQIDRQLNDIDNKIDASSTDSSNNTKLVLEKIAALKTDIGQFRTETGTRLDNITDLLAALDSLATIAQNIKTIQQDTTAMKAELARLGAIENSIKELEKKQDTTTNKVESSGSLNMAMVALLVIILVVAIVLLLVGKKGSGTSAPAAVEQEPVRRPAKTKKPSKIEEDE